MLSMKRAAVVVSAVVALLQAREAHAFKIAIDPGHGGNAPGAVGCNLEEATVNLDISLKLRDQLTSSGQTVVLTRTTDASVALSQRSSFRAAS